MVKEQKLSKPKHEVNVTLHSDNEIEFKVYSRAASLSDKRIRLDVTMFSPHCLGVYSREAFIDDVRIKTRVGLNCGLSLANLLVEYGEFENSLLLTSATLNSDRQVEQMVCLMGCALKSSIRRSIRDGTCPSVEMKKLLDQITELRNRVSLEVVDRLEEFIIMAVHIASSRVALKDQNQEKARKLAWHAQNLLAISFDLWSSYSYRWHYLKRYFYSHLDLISTTVQPSWFWTDVLGTLAAGIAMTVAVVLAWVSQRHFNDSAYVLAVALVIGYMIKDRIKEWVKRQGGSFFKLPNKMMLLSLHSRNVATVDEWYTVSETSASVDDHNKFQITRDFQLHNPMFLDTISSAAQWRHDDRYSFDKYADAETNVHTNVQTNVHTNALTNAHTNAHKNDRKNDRKNADNYDIVHVVRINMRNLIERIPSSYDKYVMIDPVTLQPQELEYKIKYRLNFKLRISTLESNRNSSWCSVPRIKPRYSTSSVAADARNAITEQEHDYVVYLDIGGLQMEQ